MDYRDAFAISKVGMALEQARLETATLNIANMNVPAKPGTEVYRAQRVVAVERGDGSDGAAFAAAYGGELRKLGETQILTTQAVEAPARMVLDPGHPDADERGFVAYPAIDHNTEMITLMTAVRAYEANVLALNSAKTMAQRALDIGGNS